MLKTILIFCFLFPGIYSQTKEISYLPVQNSSQSIKESVPIYISDSHFLIFYVSPKLDTIYFTRTFDAGNNWENPKVVRKITPSSTQKKVYLNCVKTKSGRIIVAWHNLNEGMNVFHSDDNGNNWSENQIILATGLNNINRLQYLNLAQLNDNRILLSFNHEFVTSTIYYKVSFDDGTTFIDTLSKIIFSPSLYIVDCTIVSSENDNLLCFFKAKHYSTLPFDIFMIKSTDNGMSWSDTIGVVRTSVDETELAISKNKDGSISLIYVREDTIKFYDPGYSNAVQKYIVGDVIYKQSTDFGITWSLEKRLTRYIGDDRFVGTSVNNDKNLITYSTQKITNDYQIFYGILDEAIETYHPPKLFFAYTDTFSNETRKFLLRAYVKDDDDLPKVEVSINNSNVVSQLFDDGIHDDGEASDGIFANDIDVPSSVLQNQFISDVNKITMPFTNDGKIADINYSYQFQFEFRLADTDENQSLSSKNLYVTNPNYNFGGVFDDKIFLFAGGFHISGLVNNQLWVNGVAPSSLVQDYLPGNVGSTSSDSKFGFYVVKKDDTPFGTSWLQWKNAVNLGAEFYDGDGDGIYNPKDKNYNGIWDKNEDMPALLGDITAWCIYNDGVLPSQRRWQSEIMGIEVRQTVFASSNPELENVVFLKYNLQNTGLKSDLLDSVYFGIWEDADIGEAWNDFVGCDTTLKSGFTFSNPETDTLYGYDLNPPAFFTTLLQGPIVESENPADTAKLCYGELIGTKYIKGVKNLNMTTSIMYKGGDPLINDPNYPSDVRNLMMGYTKQGTKVNPCNFAFGTVLGGVDCNQVNPKFWFSGDPVTQTGWLHILPGDVRSLTSTGPFTLDKNKPIEIIAAYVVGRGTDNINSISVTRELVKRALIEYENNFSSMTYTSGPPIYPVINYKLYHNYPNPFNPATTIRFEIPSDGMVTLKIFNILGEEVAVILNEFRKADRYEVNFNAASFASGVYVYQINVNDFIFSKKMIILR